MLQNEINFFISEIEALKVSGPRRTSAILYITIYSIEYKCESKNGKEKIQIYMGLNEKIIDLKSNQKEGSN